MRTTARIMAWIVVGTVAARAGLADEKATTLPTVFLIGDSTVNSGRGQGEVGPYGWGTPIASMFDPGKIRVENRARSGRSSRSFLTEGHWDKVLADIKPGDFVLIQFGHNDGGPLDDGRARASLKGTGGEVREVTVQATGKKETVHTYGWYLRRYVAEARAKRATPILLSPVPRNIWTADGKVVRASDDYGKWAAETARSEKVPFVDLNELIARRYEADGREKVDAEYFPPTDRTHPTRAGALVNALVVADGLRALEGCTLKDFLVPVTPK